jgi:hypothetical protein
MPQEQEQGQGPDMQEVQMDFALRFYAAQGISEEELIDTQSGGFKPEYVEALATTMQEVDNPQFWEAYMQDPDAVIQEYLQAKSPQAAQMARKGAKLERLSALRKYIK